MSSGASRRHAWKREEREIMKLLGGERIPVTGRQRGYMPDGRHPWIAPEIKSRVGGYKQLQDMMDQAEKAAEWAKRRDGTILLPLGIYHVVGQHYRNSLAFMRLGDFQDWFGDGTP